MERLIDVAEVRVNPVDYALTGILTPEGEHTIGFVFQPRSFRIGAVLSLISLSITNSRIRPVAVWKRTRNP